jgi:hypothetical protein
MVRLRALADAITPANDDDLVFSCDAKISATRDIRPGLPPRSSIAACGPSRAGKTAWVIDNQVSVANDPEEPGAVLYVPLEGKAGITKRVRAAEKRHGPAGHRFASYTGTGSLGTSDRTFANKIVTAAKALSRKAELPVKLITIDTWARALGGENENDAAVATAALNNAEHIIAETGASVVFIAHPGKDKERGMRGSYNAFASFDNVIKIEHDGEFPSPRTVILEKAKDGVEGPIGSFTLEVVSVGTDEETGDDITSCNIRPCEAEAKGGPKRLAVGSQADKAIKELHELVLAEAGEIAKGGGRAPPGVRLIPLDLWRESCRRKRLSSGDKPDAENRAFLRAVDTLTDANHIGEYDGVVWLLAGQGRSTGRPKQ